MTESWDDDYTDYQEDHYNDYDERDYYPYVDAAIWYPSVWVCDPGTGRVGRIVSAAYESNVSYPVGVEFLNSDYDDTYDPNDLTLYDPVNLGLEERLAWSIKIMKS